MKKYRTVAALVAAVMVGVCFAPPTAEAGIFRRRCSGEPRAWVKVVKASGKVVTHPFAGRVRRNQKGQLSGAF